MSARAVLLAGVLLACLGPARAGGRARAESDVARLLAAHAAGGEAAESARRSLLALGPEAVPDVLAVLGGRERIVREDRRAPALGPETRALALEALRSWPSQGVTDAIAAALPADARTHERLLAARLLGAVGEAPALEVLFAALGPLPANELAHPRVRAEVEGAFAGVLGRDERAFDALAARLGDVPDALLPSLARALARAPRAAGVQLLERLRGRRAAIDAGVLAALAAWPRTRPEVRDGSCAALAGRYLRSNEPTLRRAAAAALASLDDVESVPALVALLADDERLVRSTALRALHELTGLRWGPEAERWRSWVAGEDEWRRTRLTPCLDTLVNGGRPALLAALSELAAHRLARRELEEPVAALVAHRDPGVAAAARATLARLGLPHAGD